jgi:hypothetical protein
MRTEVVKEVACWSAGAKATVAVVAVMNAIMNIVIVVQ